MKSKSGNRAIDTFIKKIKTFKKKGINEQTEQAESTLKTMESDLKNSVGLQQEVQKLKDALKIKKNELEAELKKLKKDNQEIKKTRKKDKKAANDLKAGKKKK